MMDDGYCYQGEGELMSSEKGRAAGTFAVVDGESIRHILMSNLDAVRRVIRDAYISHEQGKTVNPHSVFLRFGDESPNRIIALPAYVAIAERAGIKWISSFPKNIDAGLPRASAILILNDVHTGYPVACLEATTISAVRTAMSAIICLEELCDGRQLPSLGIVGCGNIAATLSRILAADGWQIAEILIHDIRPERMHSFALLTAQLFPEVRIEADLGLRQTIARGAAILFATTAVRQYISDLSLFQHNPIVLHLSLRDLDPAVLDKSQNIVDDPDHVLRAGTSLDKARERATDELVIDGSIGDLILRRLRRNLAHPTVVSPFGLGMLDVALGAFAYEQAVSAGLTVDVPSFFPATDAEDWSR
jgi:N-[(2S)-2-amino-2-carboxyethyl]-L-glutamate dehydrogenase